MHVTGIRNVDLYNAPFFDSEWDKIKKIISGKQIVRHDDYIFLKKVIASEADNKVTCSKKYNLLGSTSYENFISDEEKEKALKIVNNY